MTAYAELEWGTDVCAGCDNAGWIDVHDHVSQIDDLPDEYELIDQRIHVPCGDCAFSYLRSGHLTGHPVE
jgi:hypothetical protein